MNIFLFGNGFDLSHNLPTSYPQFIQHLIDENKKDPSNFANFFKPGASNSPLDNRIVLNNFIKTLLTLRKRDPNSNWADIESHYYEELNKDNISALRLNKEFEEIKDALYNYLETIDSTSEPIQGYDNFFKSFGKKPVAISFNYTDTLRHYSDCFSEVIHIHGKLNDLLNPMIFGFAAPDNEAFDLLGKNDNTFLQNIKQYEYLSSTNFERANFLINETHGKKDIFICGHSCGISDNLILNQIFGSENVRSIYNMYFNGIDDHKVKLVNLNRTTSQKIGFDKFKPFPKCIRMPQWNDDISKEDISNFHSANNQLFR